MEKRNNARVAFQVRAVVKNRDTAIEGEVENLSTGGMFFKTAEKLSVNETVAITILLHGSSSRLALDMTGRIVRIVDAGAAIKFTELDLDSFIHLRNIVSRNSLDEKIIREYQNYRAGEAFKS